MKRLVIVMCACALIALPGCESLRAAARSKANQGMVVGSLLGGGLLTLIGSVSEHQSGLGGWIGVGAGLGALGGWYFGHQVEVSRAPEPSSQ